MKQERNESAVPQPIQNLIREYKGKRFLLD